MQIAEGGNRKSSTERNLMGLDRVLNDMGNLSESLPVVVSVAFDNMTEQEQTKVLVELKDDGGHPWAVMIDLVEDWQDAQEVTSNGKSQ